MIAVDERVKVLQSFIADSKIFDEFKIMLNEQFGEQNNQIIPFDQLIKERKVNERYKDIFLMDQFIKLESGQELNDSERYQLVEKIQSYIGFIARLKFPEIIIKNSRGQQRTIHDMYVELHFQFIQKYKDIIFLASSFGGRVTTFSRQAARVTYTHSHLSNYQIFDKTPHFFHFCLGEGPIAQIESKLLSRRYELSKDKVSKAEMMGLWKFFFIHLKSYLKWESLEGGPFRRMESVPSESINERTYIDQLKLYEISYPIISSPLVIPSQHYSVSYDQASHICEYIAKYINQNIKMIKDEGLINKWFRYSIVNNEIKIDFTLEMLNYFGNLIYEHSYNYHEGFNREYLKTIIFKKISENEYQPNIPAFMNIDGFSIFQIDRYHNQDAGFTFKGVPVKFRILQVEKEEEAKRYMERNRNTNRNDYYLNVNSLNHVKERLQHLFNVNLPIYSSNGQ